MKEASIRPQNLFDEYLRLSAINAEVYFAKNNRKDLDCPACFSDNFKPTFEKSGFQYVQCCNCSTLYLSPRPPLEDFIRFYQDSPSSDFWAKTFFPSVAEKRRELIFRPRIEKITELCHQAGYSPQVVMDVGAGYGIFLEEWKKTHPQARTLAVEPGEELAKECRKKGLEVLEAVAEEALDWEGQADLLTCFEVIEHAHNPLSFVQSLYRLVKPGGYALVSGLGVDGFDIQVLWEESKSISPPHHINFMSVKGFESLFKRAGFSSIQVSTPGQLDVDIVMNQIKNSEATNLHRFFKTLLTKDETILANFQKFLSDNQLSSHTWVWARKA